MHTRKKISIQGNHRNEGLYVIPQDLNPRPFPQHLFESMVLRVGDICSMFLSSLRIIGPYLSRFGPSTLLYSTGYPGNDVPSTGNKFVFYRWFHKGPLHIMFIYIPLVVHYHSRWHTLLGLRN